MAFKNTVGYAADPSNPLYTTGVVVREVLAQITIDSNTATTDVIKLARNLPVDAHVIGLVLPEGSAQIDGLTDVDFGFYRSDSGAVLSINALVDAVNFSAATKTHGTDLMTADRKSKIKTLLSLQSDTEPFGGVDLCASVKAEGNGTGVIDVIVRIAFPA